jgi:hypothetical protein
MEIINFPFYDVNVKNWLAVAQQFVQYKKWNLSMVHESKGLKDKDYVIQNILYIKVFIMYWDTEKINSYYIKDYLCENVL